MSKKKNCTRSFPSLNSRQLFFFWKTMTFLYMIQLIFLRSVFYHSSLSFSTSNTCIELSFVVSSLSSSFLCCQHHLFMSYIIFFLLLQQLLSSIRVLFRGHILFFSSLFFLFRDGEIKGTRTSKTYVFYCVMNA
jgi:hypothetical protein